MLTWPLLTMPGTKEPETQLPLAAHTTTKHGSSSVRVLSGLVLLAAAMHQVCKDQY